MAQTIYFSADGEMISKYEYQKIRKIKNPLKTIKCSIIQPYTKPAQSVENSLKRIAKESLSRTIFLDSDINYQIQASSEILRTKTGSYWGKDFLPYDPKKMNKDWQRGGWYLKVHKIPKVIRGRQLISYEYELNLPCFYTSPWSSPCDRGSFRRNGTGRVLPYSSYSTHPK